MFPFVFWLYALLFLRSVELGLGLGLPNDDRNRNDRDSDHNHNRWVAEYNERPQENDHQDGFPLNIPPTDVNQDISSSSSSSSSSKNKNKNKNKDGIPPHPVKPKKLHGRFLHITDIHPDPFYKVGSAVSQFCHRNKPKKDPERATYFGVPYSECDTPMSLVNLTFEYLAKEWAHQIDFVIWTGDSARHDNDNQLPRTPSAIYALNREITAKMIETFPTTPIVPTIGNNDIWPHNVMAPGPNGITNEYTNIWRPFIPFSSYQVFQRGGYYSTEIIPNQLAAISLNTIYWYDSNKAVGGCEIHDDNDPGNLQFDWLDVQLERFRARGMQVILLGHVPPSPGNYFPDCHFRYGQIAIRYQDTVVAHIYGHMNIDHFFWLDVHDLNMEPTDPNSSIYGKPTLHHDLRADFKDLPKKKVVHFDDYVIVNVGSSIVPAYLPSFRIYQYNITDYRGRKITEDETHTFQSWAELPVEGDNALSPRERYEEEEEEERNAVIKPHNRSRRSDRPVKVTGKRRHRHRHPEKPDCSKKENEKKYACRPWGPRHSSPDSPSRTNTLFSLIGYAQYYLRDVDQGTKKSPPTFKLEYLTHPVENLHPPNISATDPQANASWVKNWIPPVPKHLLPKSLRNVTRTKSRFAPYHLDDLTIPNWIKLARKLGKSNKKWKLFYGYMYMGQEVEDSMEVEDNLGGMRETEMMGGRSQTMLQDTRSGPQLPLGNNPLEDEDDDDYDEDD